MTLRRRGFGLLDVILSLTLLSILSWLMFSIFAQCSSLFGLGNSRASLQSEMRRIQVTLGREVLQTSFYTISTQVDTITVPRDDTQNMQARRDSMSCATLNDSGASASFDNISGLPKWDRYAVYMASKESPNGKLIRFLVNRTGAINDEQLVMSPALSGVVSGYPGSALPRTTKIVTHRLVHFAADTNPADQTTTLSLIIRGDAGRITTGRKTTAELLETKLIFRPENTWPRL
jgi:hypothetical protein